MDTIDYLFPEIHGIVIDNLNFHDLVSLYLTNKNFQNVLNRQDILNRILQKLKLEDFKITSFIQLSTSHKTMSCAILKESFGVETEKNVINAIIQGKCAADIDLSNTSYNKCHRMLRFCSCDNSNAHYYVDFSLIFICSSSNTLLQIYNECRLIYYNGFNIKDIMPPRKYDRQKYNHQLKLQLDIELDEIAENIRLLHL